MSIARVARVAVTAPHAVRRATAARRPFPVVRRKVAVRSNEIDLEALGLDLDALMPTSILGDLEGLQEEAGAEFDDDGVPLNFGDSAYEADILRTKVGIVDRSGGWRILRLAGPGAVDALKAAGATGEDIDALMAKGPGRGAPLDLDGGRCAAHVQAGGLLVTAPVAVADALAEAGGDAVKDLAEQCTLLPLVGPDAAELLARSGAPGVMEQEVGTHATFGFEGCPVVAALAATCSRRAGSELPACVGGSPSSSSAGSRCWNACCLIEATSSHKNEKTRMTAETVERTSWLQNPHRPRRLHAFAVRCTFFEMFAVDSSTSPFFARGRTTRRRR